ncbi:MAG: type secretion system protein [Bacillales bacterium]|jgi:pilus assembly protein CpaF|nr:type secretion system protein [Bacillales bacterium]
MKDLTDVNPELKILKDSFLNEFLSDNGITDISFNGSSLNLQHNLKGRFRAGMQPDAKDVFQLIKRIADIQGKDFTPTNPILDTELSYIRVNAIHDSISEKGISFSIRLSPPRLALKDPSDVSTEEVSQLLKVLIEAKTNIIISGSTGSGKTELQKTLVGFIPNHQKITLIEDTRDSHLKTLYPEKDINSWKTLKEYHRENTITEYELIKAGLRNNPDWILVSETRGLEAYEMLESALTGHSILTTIHSNSAEQIPSRLIRMICRGYKLNELLLGKDIVSALRFGIHMQTVFTEQGIKRFIKEIVEFVDFNDKGALAIPIYQSSRNYNQNSNKYIVNSSTGKLSAETIQRLTNEELIHKVPKCFW